MKNSQQGTTRFRWMVMVIAILIASAAAGTRLPGAAAFTINGLTATNNQLWEQKENLPGLPEETEGNPLAGTYLVGDQLGRVVSSGDFNGDGYADLAIGVPGEDSNTVVVNSDYTSVGKGMVMIIYGSASGLNNSAATMLEEGVNNFPGIRGKGDMFGAALAAADFNNDGYSDLAIGTPGTNSEIMGEPVDELTTNAVRKDSGKGSVRIVYGSESGLNAGYGAVRPSQYLGQNSLLHGDPEKFDRLGSALTAGDFNKDGYADLAIGVPGEDGGAGAVNIIYGSAQGLSDTPFVVKTHTQIFHQNSDGILGGQEADDHFGASLAAGDFNQDGYSDLAIGVPNEGLGGAHEEQGSVAILYGSETGLGAWNGPGNQLWDEDGDEGAAYDLVGLGYEKENFGAAVTAGDFNHDGADDLAVGIPRESSVAIIFGSPAGLQSTNNQLLGAGANNNVEMGRALTTGDFNGDDITDLAVGAPEDGDTNKGGSVRIYLGTSSGPLAQEPHQTWGQNSPGISGGAEENDWFGDALATGDFDNNGFPDLAVGVWGEDGDSGAVAVIYASGNHAPVADAGGPYTATNCGNVVLNGMQSYDKNQPVSTLAFRWDLDGDNDFGEMTGGGACGFEIGPNPVFYPSCFPSSAFTGSTSIQVSLKVIDSLGSFSISKATIKLVSSLPVLIVPGNITVPATPTLCQSMVNQDLLQATATSICQSVTVTGTRSDGKALTAYYPIGVTVITWKANDSSGLATTGLQLITVIDDQAPVLNNVPDDMNLIASPGQTWAYYLPVAPTANDCSSGTTVTGTRTDGQTLASPYQLGWTRIIWKATDGAGNQTTQAQDVIVRTQTDVGLTLVSSDNPAYVGQALSLQLNVSNSGTAMAYGVQATVTLPGNLTFVSANPSVGSCSYDSSAHRIACDLGALTQGVSRPITIRVTGNAAGMASVIATGAANLSFTADSQSANNNASVSINVRP